MYAAGGGSTCPTRQGDEDGEGGGHEQSQTHRTHSCTSATITAHVLVIAPAEAAAPADGSCAGLKARRATQEHGAAVAEESKHRHGCRAVTDASRSLFRRLGSDAQTTEPVDSLCGSIQLRICELPVKGLSGAFRQQGLMRHKVAKLAVKHQTPLYQRAHSASPFRSAVLVLALEALHLPLVAPTTHAGRAAGRADSCLIISGRLLSRNRQTSSVRQVRFAVKYTFIAGVPSALLRIAGNESLAAGAVS